MVEYTDAEEGFKGWLAIDRMEHSLCAGGMRVQKGITREHVVRMAHNMTKKMKLCGLPIDGAKCGIDYPPEAPGKKKAMLRFMRAIRPFITAHYSMGPDLNTDMDELEDIAKSLGFQSVKGAIAKAQGMSLDDFQRRYATLAEEVAPGWSLGRVRAGHGVAAAVLGTLDFLKIPPTQATIAVQGFGTLAKAALLELARQKVRPVALADARQTMLMGTDSFSTLQELLKEKATLLPHMKGADIPQNLPRETIFETECDILVLAAIEKSLTAENAHLLHCKAVVPGANLAVTKEAEDILFQRGIPVLPCFLAGCGGSLSMNGLFGPETAPSPQQVLAYIESSMKELVLTILSKSSSQQQTPTSVAETICREVLPVQRKKPYAI